MRNRQYPQKSGGGLIWFISEIFALAIIGTKLADIVARRFRFELDFWQTFALAILMSVIVVFAGRAYCYLDGHLTFPEWTEESVRIFLKKVKGIGGKSGRRGLESAKASGDPAR